MQAMRCNMRYPTEEGEGEEEAVVVAAVVVAAAEVVATMVLMGVATLEVEVGVEEGVVAVDGYGGTNKPPMLLLPFSSGNLLVMVMVMGVHWGEEKR